MWSPIRFVIIRVIDKIRGSPICVITTMITDRIVRLEILLPINHNFNKICDNEALFLNQSRRNSNFFLLAVKKSNLRVLWYQIVVLV